MNDRNEADLRWDTHTSGVFLSSLYGYISGQKGWDKRFSVYELSSLFHFNRFTRKLSFHTNCTLKSIGSYMHYMFVDVFNWLKLLIFSQKSFYFLIFWIQSLCPSLSREITSQFNNHLLTLYEIFMYTMNTIPCDVN